MLTGQYKSFKMHGGSGSHSKEEVVKILQSSVAFPGVFKSIEAFNSVWFTGSAIYEADVLGPINYCRKIGYKDEDIVIDVILSGNPHLPHVYAKFYSALGIAERTMEIIQYYQRMFGVLRAKSGHPSVNYRYIIGPNRDMPNKIVPLQYTRDEVINQIEIGKKDAVEHIKTYKQIE